MNPHGEGRSGRNVLALAAFLLTPLALLAMASLFLQSCQARSSASGGPRLKFAETTHDFGKLSASQPAEYRFALTNVGSTPLEIGDVRPEPPRPGT